MSEKINSTRFLLFLGLGSFLIGLLFINTCKRIYLDTNELTEGKVVYTINYPEVDSNHLFKPFLPFHMVLKIKGKKLKVETKAGLGLFQTSLIADLRKKEAVSLLKQINVKYKTSMGQDFFDIQNELMEMSIEKIDSQSVRLGETVSYALVKYPWSEQKDTIEYCTDTYAENVNFHNGFPFMSNILLSYKQRVQGVLMEFTAIQISRESVSDAEFKIDSEYKDLKRIDYFKELNKSLSPLRN